MEKQWNLQYLLVYKSPEFCYLLLPPAKVCLCTNSLKDPFGLLIRSSYFPCSVIKPLFKTAILDALRIVLSR